MPLPFQVSGASGQSSLEYVGLLTLVGAVLALGGPLVGGSGIGAEVARVVRTGICIVGGDVCRPADARAAELSPCTLADARRGGGGGLTIFSVRIGENHHWTVARRSDGSVLVTRDDGDEAGVSGGLGLELGALRLGVDASLSLTGASGASWEFRDTAAAARFLADVKRGRESRWRPAWRFGDLGAVTNAGGGLGVHLGGADGVDPDVAGVELSAGAAVGARVGRGETTLYLRLGGNGPQVSDRLGHSVGLGTTGPALVEYTRDRSGPRELAFRTTVAGARPGQVVEVIARLDLRAPEHRAVAARLLRAPAPWPPAMLRDVLDVMRYTVANGTVERSVYAVSDASHDFALAGRLGLELGVELEKTSVDRRLVAASAWTPGSKERLREDCMRG